MSPESPLAPYHLAGPADPAARASQSGSSILGIVAVLGLVFALVQGTLFYRAKASAKFIGSEKNKILAQQIAEAGVEETIADLGSRALVPTSGMNGLATYTGKPVGAGTFSTQVTTIAVSPDADTLMLTSLGRVASVQQSVQARLRVKRYMDTTLTPIMEVTPETTLTIATHTRADTTYTVTVQDPYAMPDVDETPAYTACMSSSAKKCDVCHIPGGNPDNRHVISISKSAIHTHISHHGDYVTTDGTCDIYKPKSTRFIALTTFQDTTVVITDHTVYDTLAVIDTLAKVQILSWK